MASPAIPLLSAAAAAALSGTVDPVTGVKYLAKNADEESTPLTGFEQWMIMQYQTLLVMAGAGQGMVIDLEDGLKVGVYPLTFSVGGTTKSYAGVTSYTLTASQTNYIWLDGSALLQHGTAWPGTDHFRLAVAVCDATDVTSVTDARFENMQVGSVNNWSNYQAQGDVDMKVYGLDDLAFLNFSAGTELTISGGSVTPTRLMHTVDTEADAASDTLDTLTAVAGERRLVALRLENAARTVLVKDTGNITLLDGDFNMTGLSHCILLLQDSDTTWIELTRNEMQLETLKADLDIDGNELKDFGSIRFAATELTISGGAVTVSEPYHKVTGSGDLDTITRGGSTGNDIVVIFPGNLMTDNFTVKHNTGNVLLANGKDCVFNPSSQLQALVLAWDVVGSTWMEIARHYTDLADLAGTGEAIPYSMVVSIPGTLSVKTYEQNVFCPVGFTIKDITGVVNTAPTGAALIVDVRDDGSSIFAGQAEMVNIAAGTTQDTSAEKDHAVAASSILTVEVEQIGSGTAGADLVLTINGYVAAQTPPT